jgi:hypothetical protein
MLDGDLPAEVVALEYAAAFRQLASPIMDADTFWQLNHTYYTTMLLDARHPAIPTRERGVWHVCSKCNPDGTFIDERTGKRVRTEDWRFRAAHVFRFIGFALSWSGYPCGELWDMEAPGGMNYGGYNSRPCAPLPPAKHVDTNAGVP